jgi:(2Fe-2S) ferredoxin
MRYPFEKLFLICTGDRCNNSDRGKERGEVIRAELKDLNKSLGRKRTVRICAVSCLDLCDFGPNIVVEPGHEVHSGMNRESAERLYHEVMGDDV